jgi:5-methylcytosine-specific restriction endonuclease McrA
MGCLASKEKKKELRDRQFGPKAEWIRSLPCCACGTDGPCDAAHMKSRGAGGTSDHLVPLCRECHTEQHTTGIKTFFSKHGVIDILDLAERYHQKWLYAEYWDGRKGDMLY